MSRKEINSIVEKYLNTYQFSLVPGLPVTYDVFENPSSKEMRECQQNGGARFIADNKTKIVYCWDGEQALHNETWHFISKDKNDSRKIYKTPDLLVGVYIGNGREIQFESNYLYGDLTWKTIKDTDWKWAERYLKNLTKFLDKAEWL